MASMIQKLLVIKPTRPGIHILRCVAACGLLDLLVIRADTDPKIIQRSMCSATRCYVTEDQDPISQKYELVWATWRLSRGIK
jgi:hypothetical protein